MGAHDWSTDPDRNATSDPGLPARDGTSGRQVPSLLRTLMANVAALTLDQGGALVTGGSGNAYVVDTMTGVRAVRPGLSLLVQVDRANTGAVSLNVDGTGPRPWLDMGGGQIPSGTLQPNAILRATWSAPRGAWVSDLLGPLTTAVIDTAMRLWWQSLPNDPRGIGPNAPWRSGGFLAFTAEDNATFTVDSPAGRRLTLQLIKEALPTSPEGLNPGEPYLSGDMIAFVPPTA